MINFWKSSRGRSQGLQKIFRAPIYRSHHAVIFAIAQLSCFFMWPNTRTPTRHHFNIHFPGKPSLASCPLDSQSPVILILIDVIVSQDRPILFVSSLQAIPHHYPPWQYLRRRSFHEMDAFAVARPTARQYIMYCRMHKLYSSWPVRMY